jgi:tetratricopeptide (TPR) repeat protein
LAHVEASLPEQLPPEELHGLCDELEGRPSSQQRLFARNSPRAGRPEVCRELMRRSEAARHESPVEMTRWAKAAVAVAESLGEDAAPAGILADLRAESLACLANALRVAGDIPRSEQVLQSAEQHLASGSGDPLLKAELVWRRGVLRRKQGRQAEAISDLQQAAEIFLRIGEQEKAGQLALSLGIAYFNAGDLEGAIRSTMQGGRLVARSGDPALLLSAVHNLVTYLDEAGYSEHAASLLDRLRELHDAAPGDLSLIRLRWLEGKIAAGLGKQIEARAALNAVRREFLAKGMLYDAAIVALELAALYAEAGWTFEVEKLAEEMYPVFISRDLPREASATLLLFVDAVNRRAATGEWIRKLAADLSSQRDRKA